MGNQEYIPCARSHVVVGFYSSYAFFENKLVYAMLNPLRKKRVRPHLVRGLGPWIGLANTSPLFGNILFLGVVYSRGTTNPTHTGLAKPFKNEWLS